MIKKRQEAQGKVNLACTVVVLFPLLHYPLVSFYIHFVVVVLLLTLFHSFNSPFSFSSILYSSMTPLHSHSYPSPSSFPWYSTLSVYLLVGLHVPTCMVNWQFPPSPSPSPSPSPPSPSPTPFPSASPSRKVLFCFSTVRFFPSSFFF